MSWIRIVDVAESDGALRQAYDEVGKARGTVANIIKLHSLVPAVMTKHVNLYREIMFSRSELTRSERELVATAVSSANACHY